MTTSKQILQPNEKAIIDVQWDSGRFRGQKSKAAWVTVGPPYLSDAVLTVKAVSCDEIVCHPGELAFGSVSPGQSPSATIDVEYTGPLAWQVSEAVVQKDQPFEATVKELYRRPGQVGYRVKVSLKKEAAPGQFQESIFLRTNDPTAGLLSVPVKGNIQLPLEAIPAAMNLKEVKSGETLTRRVVVRGRSAFKILSIEGPGAVKAAKPPLPAVCQTVMLQVVSPPQAGPFHYEVKIKTDLQDSPVVVIIEGVVPSN